VEIFADCFSFHSTVGPKFIELDVEGVTCKVFT
jgi:hypothetical protein